MLAMLWTMSGLAFAQENVQDVYSVLSRDFDANRLERAAIEGMLGEVERQTGIEGSKALTKSDYETWQQWRQGSRDGYGLRIQVVAGRGFLVEHVMKDSPAAKAGLLEGDFVVSVNTRSLSGLAGQHMLSLLESEDDERLLLELIRDNELKQVKLYRGQFDVPQVSIPQVTPHGSTVQVHFFGQGSADKIANSAKESNISILDFRDNSGGLWEEAVATLDVFLPSKTVVAHRRHHDGNQIPILAQQSPLQTEPIVILVNQGTQGPAELVALTLQEQGVATVVGERSAGVGVDYHPLYPNKEWVLLMADTILLSSKKQSWHSIGVVPNLTISDQQSYRGEDRQLQTAIQLTSSTP